jgi:hypothetical protein
MEKYFDLPHDEVVRSRRAAMLMGGAALAALALSRNASAQAAAPTPSPTLDAEILNFALNLEFLESQFYTLATAGVTIDKYSTAVPITSGSGAAGGSVTLKPNFAPVPFVAGSNAQNYAMETAGEERNHVLFLQSALNASSANASVAMPNIDLYNSFNALAMAAGIGATFDPFASPANFLIGAFIFEDVGVTAYLGAAPLIYTPAYLTAALDIHAVEGYHAGSIRTQIYAAGAPLTTYSQQVAAARATLDGSTAAGGADDIGVETLTGSASTIVDANPTLTATYAARVQPRSTTQVLQIVYGGGAVGTGGAFFPNGMNGSIK